jgi:hypothetical protein
VWVCAYCEARHPDNPPTLTERCHVCSIWSAANAAAVTRDALTQTNVIIGGQMPHNVKRLRLGWRTPVQGPDAGTFLRLTGKRVAGQWLRFYVPGSFGPNNAVAGQGIQLLLRLETESGQLRYHGLAAGLNAPPRLIGSNLTIPLSTGAQGWYYMQLDGSSDTSVTVNLVERCYARVAAAVNAAPLIPWSFYFWTASRYDGRAVAFLPAAHFADTVLVNGNPKRITKYTYSPFEKFDRAFPGAHSFAWESDDSHLHVLPAADDNPTQFWQGHCDAAAAASILFEPPEALTAGGPVVVNGQSFDYEELKLFATEYAFNFSRGAGVKIWQVADNHPGASRSPWEQRPKVKIGTAYAAANASERTVTVNQEIIVNGPPLNGSYWDLQGKRFPAASAAAPGFLAQTLETNRGLMGTAAAQFHGFLRDHIGTLGEPMLSDLRAPLAADAAALATLSVGDRRKAAAQLWNQAIFYYEAWYKEYDYAEPVPGTLNHASEKRCAQDIVLTVRFEANADSFPTQKPPATVGGPNGVTLSNLGWTRTLEYRLQFQDDGTIDGNNVLNDWLTCSDKGRLKPYPIPRYLDSLVGLANVSNGGGNPDVDAARIHTLGLRVRTRYNVFG